MYSLYRASRVVHWWYRSRSHFKKILDINIENVLISELYLLYILSIKIPQNIKKEVNRKTQSLLDKELDFKTIKDWFSNTSKIKFIYNDTHIRSKSYISYIYLMKATVFQYAMIFIIKRTRRKIVIFYFNYLLTSLIYLLTHLLTYSLIYLLTHSLTHSLIYLLTYSLTHLLTHSLTYSSPYLLPHSPTYSFTYLLTYLLIVNVWIERNRKR